LEGINLKNNNLKIELNKLINQVRGQDWTENYYVDDIISSLKDYTMRIVTLDNLHKGDKPMKYKIF